MKITGEHNIQEGDHHHNTAIDGIPPYLLDGVTHDVDTFLQSKEGIQKINEGIRKNLIGTGHSVINKAAAYFLNNEEEKLVKKVRPVIFMIVILKVMKMSNNEAAYICLAHNIVWSKYLRCSIQVLYSMTMLLIMQISDTESESAFWEINGDVVSSLLKSDCISI